MPRVVVTSALPGPANMELDLALLALAEAGSGPFLRLYAWDGPWLSLGYFQRGERAVDLERARELGIGIVRRPTGGKALLHDRDLTYSVAVPAGHPVARLNVVESYRVISERVVAGLQAAGVPAVLEEGGGAPGRAERANGVPCATEVHVESIMLAGRKLVGSAQVRRHGAILQHGSIPLSEPAPEVVRTLFPRATEADRAWLGWYRERTTTLEREGAAVERAALEAALVEAFAGF